MTAGFFDTSLLSNHDHSSNPGDGGQLSNIAILGTLSTTGDITDGGALNVNGGNLDFLNDGTMGIKGNTIGNFAAVGNVGEFLSAARLRQNELLLVTATDTNLTSIPLTAGQWLVVCQIGFDEDATTVVSGLRYSFSNTSATLTNGNTTMATQDASGQMRGEFDYTSSVLGNTARTYTPLVTVVNLAAPATYWLVANVAFTTANLYGYGSIIALRIR